MNPFKTNDPIEATCGAQDSRYVLIAYDTIHGSTAEVAEYIGNELCDLGFRVDVRLAANVADISSYDAVIVGSAIYQFNWLEGAKAFLQQNREALAQLPTAYFIVGASMYKDTPASRKSVKRFFVDPVLQEFDDITPVSIGLFGGAVDFTANQYKFFERFVLRILGLFLGFRDSADWRNWDTISGWSNELAGKF
jgi:menaquinone-dependent protoporphyrinogen oxidase